MTCSPKEERLDTAGNEASNNESEQRKKSTETSRLLTFLTSTWWEVIVKMAYTLVVLTSLLFISVILMDEAIKHSFRLGYRMGVQDVKMEWNNDAARALVTMDKPIQEFFMKQRAIAMEHYMHKSSEMIPRNVSLPSFEFPSALQDWKLTDLE